MTHVHRSEGFPLTCYFILGRDGTGVWTTGKFRRRLPPFLQKAKTDSDITGLIRPAGGEENLFKINRISFKIEKSVFQLFVGAINRFSDRNQHFLQSKVFDAHFLLKP